MKGLLVPLIVSARSLIPGSQSGSKFFFREYSNETHLFEIDTLRRKMFSDTSGKRIPRLLYLPTCVGTGTYDNAISNYTSIRHVVVTFTVNSRARTNSRSADDEDVIRHKCIDGLLL